MANKMALIIIDMQQAYFNDPVLASMKDLVINNCNMLMRNARDNGLPIYNVRTEHKKDGSTWTLNMKHDMKDFLLEGTDEVATIAGLDTEGAVDLVKTRDSAFFKTELESMLSNAQVDTIVLCGVSTQSCIAQTAADAYAANIKVILATQAIASHRPEYEPPMLTLLQTEYRQRLADTETIIGLMASIRS